MEPSGQREACPANLVNPALTAALTDDVEKATALFNEAFTYLRLASDHAKFIRNYFDPTQEALFRQADSLATRLDQLRSQLCSLQEPVAPATVNAFVRQALPVVTDLIEYKRRVENLIRACQTQQLSRLILSATCAGRRSSGASTTWNMPTR